MGLERGEPVRLSEVGQSIHPLRRARSTGLGLEPGEASVDVAQDDSRSDDGVERRQHILTTHARLQVDAGKDKVVDLERDGRWCDLDITRHLTPTSGKAQACEHALDLGA